MYLLSEKIGVILTIEQYFKQYGKKIDLSRSANEKILQTYEEKLSHHSKFLLHAFRFTTKSLIPRNRERNESARFYTKHVLSL